MAGSRLSLSDSALPPGTSHHHHQQRSGGASAGTSSFAAVPAQPDPLGRPPISWRCDVCGYHMLAMDHRGQPLPLERGPRGDLLPVFCSRCGIDHTDWTPATPFDTLGDHANVKAAFSDKVNAGVPLEDPRLVRQLVEEHAPNVAALQNALRADAELDADPRHAGSGRRSGKNGAANGSSHGNSSGQAYACARCGRRLLRMDTRGELVPLDRDARGQLVPLECPGCHASHADWIATDLHTRVKPMVHAPAATSAVTQRLDADRAILTKPFSKNFIV